VSLITPDVLVILILDGIFAFFGTIAFILSFKIVLNWDISKTTTKQYRLEKQSYLVATIIKYILFLKLPLFLYFIYVQDKLSVYIPGAMCAVGVVNSTMYGFYAMIVKIANLYLFSSWLVLNKVDLGNEKMPYTKIKFIFFIIIYLFLMSEIVLEVMEFFSLDPARIVSCCGTVFSAAGKSAISSILSLPNTLLVGVFYANFILVLVTYKLRNPLYYALVNILFVVTSIISLISFFGTYIYELPTHHCPFCMLQSDYHYIGYILYTTLFLGTFSAIARYIILLTGNKRTNFGKISLIFDTVYVIIVSSYPVIFYLRNGVWL
jgi:hypothetical protein